MEAIYNYSRKEAIQNKDQFQIEENLSKEFFKYPVFFTSGVMDIVNQAVANKKWLNDYNSIIFDILNICAFSAKSNKSDKNYFDVRINGAGKKKIFWFMSVCSAMDLDNPSPCITIMLQKEN